MQTKWKKTKNNSAKSKKHESKIKGEQKGKSKGHTKKTKMNLSICFFFLIYCVFRFLFLLCFIFCFFCLEKKHMQHKSNKKNKSRKQNKSTWTRPFFHISLVLKLCFLIFHVFSCFFIFCFKLKLIRISNWGEHEFRWITTICTEWSDWS